MDPKGNSRATNKLFKEKPWLDDFAVEKLRTIHVIVNRGGGTPKPCERSLQFGVDVLC